MSAFKLLLVEDEQANIDLCKSTIDRYLAEKNREFCLVECRSIEEFHEKRDNSIDGAIIDLKLDENGDEGNQVIREIEDSHFRIPIAILTGTPSAANNDLSNIGVYKRGEVGYSELFDNLWGIHDTGLTRIMGGRGTIEYTLNQVYKQSLLPQINKWVVYGETDSSKTEKSLLRHALSHLLQLLDDDGDRCFPEEVYLIPPLTEKIRTGGVVKEKKTDQRFVVMNPACDLVIRDNGACNTDRILIVEIDLQSELFPGYPANGLSKSQKSDLEKAFRNNKSAYYHWLPKTDFFEGGFLNFRKLISLSSEEFTERFEKPTIQISPSFVKDMVARFSAYYARQGQPDIEFEHFINSPIVKTENP